ncbi:alpha/beta hydrolase [Flavobacteriaceae bacterium TP-CH-4]|uniref:Alpha/beta hydrolase n=1 Tax=Pelagihabitans pacificus TaxID=2696054 RepID=A0A967AV74_9FLAO|nr:hypothetical protein [Pelagihabitans pacificus]NHF60833.1 alpha/beta hydrolase [Pelagihabitans pacificus]
MRLQKQVDPGEEKKLVLNDINIKEGAGVFLVEGGNGKKDKPIKVFYYRPKTFTSNSKIMLVLPGAGRNGDSYRDAWIPESDKYGYLILALAYSEEDYPFEDYHLCGVVTDFRLGEGIEFVENSNIVKLDENKVDYGTITKQEDWIFMDFDRIFDLAVEATKSNQEQYDIFGHSAGGQILHRFALLGKNSKAKDIFASNSGFYTLPDFNTEFPFGLKNTPLRAEDLKEAFKKRLVLVVGEQDNQNETRGTLLRSTTADMQGLHRLERATFFFDNARSTALKMKTDFNWELKIVPKVGHDHVKIGDYVTTLLIQKEKNPS